MANIQSAHAKGIVPAPNAMGQEAVVIDATLDLTAAQVSTSNVFEMAKIPPGFKVVDWTYNTDDLDTGGSPALVVKIGVLNSGKTDLDSGNAIWKTGITSGQAGGIQRMDNQNALRQGSSTSERIVGVIPTTNPATAAAGTIGVTLYLKAD